MRSPSPSHFAFVFSGPNFWCTPKREAAVTLVLSCPHCGGLPGFGLHCFLEFSFISDFRLSCPSVFLTNSCFQVFVANCSRHRPVTYGDRPPAFIEANGHAAPPSPIFTRMIWLVVFLFTRASQSLFLAWGRAKPRSQATVGAGLRIDRPVFFLRC